MKMKYVFYAVISMALLAVAAFAQPGGLPGGAGGVADNESTVEAAKALGGGLGFGILAGLAGIGQGLVGSKAAEGTARNPAAASSIQTIMIIALALIESLVLFGLVIVFAKL